MNKEQKNVIMEYVDSLSEENLKFLSTRLKDKFSGDIPDALDYLSEEFNIDNVLGAASSAMELYDLCDFIGGSAIKECKKRGISAGHHVAV